MFKPEQIAAFADKNKALIFGLFLSTTILRFAIGNLFLIALAVLFFSQVFWQKKILIKQYSFPLMAYFFWGVASIIWTTSYSNTLNGIGIALPLILVPLLSAQYADFVSEEIKKTIRVFSLGLLFYLSVCLVKAGFKYLQDKQLIHFFYHDLVSIFDNNAIYISLAVAACILLVFSWPEKKRTDYLLLFSLIVFLFLLSSKNIIITTFFLLGLSLVKNKRTLKTGMIVSALFGLIFLLILFSDNPIKHRFLDESHLNLQQVLTGKDFYEYKFSGLEIRLFQWRLMGEMISQGQIGFWGLGLHNVDYLSEQYFSYYNAYKGYFQINFHNQYLQTFGEMGFVGLFLLLGIFIYAIYKSVQQREVHKLYLSFLFMSAFFTESFLNRQKGIFLFAIFYCLLFMNSQSAQRKHFKIDL